MFSGPKHGVVLCVGSHMFIYQLNEEMLLSLESFLGLNNMEKGNSQWQAFAYHLSFFYEPKDLNSIFNSTNELEGAIYK